MSLPTRKIGQTEVSAIGYGAMGISKFYGKVTQTDEERFAVCSSAILRQYNANRNVNRQVLDAVYANGCKFIDTSVDYGDSEELIGRWCVLPHLVSSSASHLLDFNDIQPGSSAQATAPTSFSRLNSAAPIPARTLPARVLNPLGSSTGGRSTSAQRCRSHSRRWG